MLFQLKSLIGWFLFFCVAFFTYRFISCKKKGVRFAKEVSLGPLKPNKLNKVEGIKN
jgi:hypothetical protein